MTQYVACKFRISDTRTFTYKNDGEPVAEGDAVRVTDRSGDGWKKVFVVSVTDVDPCLPFDLKPILGKHVEPEAPDDDIFGAPNSSDEAPAAPRGNALDAPLAF